VETNTFSFQSIDSSNGHEGNSKGQINPKKEFHSWIECLDLEFISGSRAMSEMVRHGMIARNRRIPRIEKMSASLPVKGIIIPPSPKPRPIMRLETIDLPLGASSCAMATPSGKVAIAKRETGWGLQGHVLGKTGVYNPLYPKGGLRQAHSQLRLQ